MATFIDITRALASAGYLSAADIEAAADVLDDSLIIVAAENAQSFASEDYSTQEDIIAKAENWAQEDALVGNTISFEEDQDIILDALDQKAADMAVMAGGEVVIDEAYLDAASALLTAGLIDETNLEAAAAIIAKIWTMEED